MRRRPATIRYLKPRHRTAAASPPVPCHLIAVFATLLAFCYASAAPAQSGVITTVVGPSLVGNASGSSLQLPTGVAVIGSGAGATIYTADANNCVVWQTQNDQTSIFAGILATSPGTCGYAPPQSSPTETFLPYPVSLAACNGNVFIASHGIDPFIPQFSGQTATAGTVDEVDSSGTLSALPLPSGPLYPLAVACDASGNVYVSSFLLTSSQDGVPAGEVDEFSPASGGGWTTETLLTASELFNLAYTALAVDPTSGNPTSGNLFGILAGQVGNDWLGTPDMSGSDKIENITTGVAAVSANNTFFDASGLAINGSSDFLISTAELPDEYSSYVEQVTPDGTITVLAGTGTAGYSGDGGLGTSAEVNGVDQLVLDSAGNLYMADSENQRIRRIHPLVAGPSTLTLSSIPVPQSSGAQFGSLQGVLNPNTGDFYFVSGVNTVNVINTGSNYVCPGCERIFASIPVGLNNGGSTSTLTLALDPTQNLVYVSNSADGNLYVINGVPGQPSSYTLSVDHASLGYQQLSLLAVDPGLNEVYAAGPTSTTIVALSGGAAPQVLSTYTALDAPIESLSVDTATHTVYAMGVLLEGYGGDYPLLYTITPGTGGALTVSTTQIGAVGQALPTGAFNANSIVSDPQSGSLLVAGGNYYNSTVDDYVAFDIFTFSPSMSEAPLLYPWQPFTTSLDVPNRAFYITDFDGNSSDNNSNAVMVTGMDSVSVGDNTLSSTAIPAFGGTVSSPQTASSPHIYDIEPDTSSYQAWISGSDATDGGFIKLWDASTQAVTLSATFPAIFGQPYPAGGHLFVDSSNHAAYLIDQVNNYLWLLNKPQWTPTLTPSFSQAGALLTITAGNSTDTIYYTEDGTPPGPGLSSTTISCPSPCTVSNLSEGGFTTISAIEVNSTSGDAGNVAQGQFTVASPTSLGLAVSPSPATTGASITATATLTTNSSAVTGTVNFTATFNGVATTLCSSVSVELNAGSWQAACSFTETVAGSYSIDATFSGDTLNEPSMSSTVSFTVNQSTIPVPGTVSGTATPIAINSNNESGQTTNAVLNNDSSVTLVQNGTISGSCQAFSSLSGSTVSQGGVFFDGASNTIYVSMIYGNDLYAGYETPSNTPGQCTQAMPVQLVSAPNEYVEMNVDLVQKNVYIVNSFGANPDMLYVLPTAPWTSAPTPATETLDYSATYGPIVIDPTGDRLVYINDFSDSTEGLPGTYQTSGFFVYDPMLAKSVHVAGYMTSSTASPTPFNVGTLLDNGNGELALVNENPKASSTTYSSSTPPVTVLNTTVSGFSFFNNTQPGTAYNTVDIVIPPAAVSTISPVAAYYAISGADINAADNLVYAFAFNPSDPEAPGELIEYNYSALQETVLSSSVAMAGPNGEKGPWVQLNYDPVSTEIALSESAYNSGALGVTTPLCAGSPSLTTVIGNGASLTALDYPVVNSDSGFIYAIEPPVQYPPPATPAALEYLTPPANPCSISQPTPASITVVSGSGQSTAIGSTFPNQLIVEVADSNNNPVSGVTVTFAAPASGASASLSSSTATTNSSGNASVTATANGIASSTAYTVSATVAGVGTPASFSLTNTFAPTALTVTPSATSIVYGQSATINASISPSNVLGTTPTGSVAFYDGSTALTPVSTVSGAAATYTVSVPAVGSHTYAAQYLGDANFQASTLTSATSAVVVGKANVTLTGPTPPVYLLSGQGGSIPVNIAGQYSGSGIATPTGGLSCSVSNNAFACGSLPVTNGTASISVPNTLEAGQYTITVSYAGDVNYSANSIQIQLTVYPPIMINPTSLPVGIAGTVYSQTLTASGGSGGPYTWTGFSADGLTLSPAGVISGTPTTAGTVSFNALVTDSLGDTASLTYQLIIAVGIVDNESISVSDADVVNAFTLSAPISVSAPVAFFSTGSPLTFGGQSGNQQTIAIENIGQASMTLTSITSIAISTGAVFTPSAFQCFNGASATGASSATLPTGGFCTLTITYTGSAPSTDNGTLTFTDNAGLSNLTSTASSSPNSYTQSIVLDGECPTGSTCPTAPPPAPPATVPGPPDNETITVTDTENFTVTTAPGFTLSPAPVSVSVAQGGSVTSTITVADFGGFSGTVALAASGLPNGVTSSFAAGSASGTQVLTLTASASAQVTSSAVTVTITGTSGTTTAITSISLSITPQPSFTAGSGSTTAISVTPGATTGNTGTISIVGTNGFTGTINLSCAVTTTMTNVSDMPSCSLSPTSVVINGATVQTSTLTVSTTAASSSKSDIKKLIWPTGGTALALIVFLALPRRRRSWLVFPGMLLLFVLIGVVGCGGHSSSGGGSGGGGNPGTTAGGYTITVTGTAGSVSTTVGTITLTVQ